MWYYFLKEPATHPPTDHIDFMNMRSNFYEYEDKFSWVVFIPIVPLFVGVMWPPIIYVQCPSCLLELLNFSVWCPPLPPMQFCIFATLFLGFQCEHLTGAVSPPPCLLYVVSVCGDPPSSFRGTYPQLPQFNYQSSSTCISECGTPS